MLKAIQFKNFKALRDITLPLTPFNLLIGPNGSGKSTVLEGLRAVKERAALFDRATIGARIIAPNPVSVSLLWDHPFDGQETQVFSQDPHGVGTRHIISDARTGSPATVGLPADIATMVQAIKVYIFDAGKLASPVTLAPAAALGEDGANFVVVLDNLRDKAPERFESINRELSSWLPEYDRILFDTPHQGARAFSLRQRIGGASIPARFLSTGTLYALAMLTLANLPEPPSIVGIEEPDHGLHPRLMLDVKNALYRLAHPEACGDSRPPTQVIATTHSPYMVDLFRDHPEEVIVAENKDGVVSFQRLDKKPHFKEILGDDPLGEAWYNGIFGGVPQRP